MQGKSASRSRLLFGLSGFLVFWLNDTNQMNQINQTNKTNQIDQIDQMDQTESYGMVI